MVGVAALDEAVVEGADLLGGVIDALGVLADLYGQGCFGVLLGCELKGSDGDGPQV